MNTIGRDSDTAGALDLELAQAAAGGDRDAFERLMRLHERDVFRLAYNVCGSSSDAEDAAQEVFLCLYRKLGTFRGESKFTTWLYRLTMNVSLNYRRRVMDHAPPLAVSLRDEDDESADPVDEAADTDPGPEDMVVDAERTAAVRRAVDALPDEFREAFILREITGLDYSEIGELLNIGIGTVKSRLFRARERLRKLLSDAGMGAGNIFD